MSKNTKIALGILFLFFIGVLGLLFRKPTTSAESIKIGFIGPLTGAGTIYGESTKGGVVLAVDEINKSGGVNGRKIQVIYEDGKCNGKDASTAAQKLIDLDNVKYIIGMPCSGEVLGVAPISEKNKVIIAVQGSSPDITNAGKYIVRTFPSDLLSSQTIAEHSITKNFKTAGIITENSDYPMALNKAFQNAYTEKGGVVLNSEIFNSGTTNFRTILTKIKSTKPDMIFIDTQTGGNATMIAKQARELDIKSQFYTAFFSGPEFVESGNFVNGTYVVDVPTLNPTNPIASRFLTSYEKINGTKPSYPFFAAGAYDQTNIIINAIKQIDYSNTDEVRSYLHSIQTYNGVIGPFHFDNNGDVSGITLRMVRIENNKIVDTK